MRKIAIVAVCVGALGLLGCGGGGGDDDDDDDIDGGIIFTDASSDPDTPPTVACNPIAQTGCEPTEKCTFIIEGISPTLGYIGCAPIPENPIGENESGCTDAYDVTPPPSQATPHIDECDKYLFCSDEVCREICTTSPQNCPDKFSCVGTHGIFDDATGMCNPGCTSLHAQYCEDTDKSCYLLFLEEYTTVCFKPTSEPDTAHDGCVEAEKPDEEPQYQGECCSYINTCAKRFGCTQPSPPPVLHDQRVCAGFCDPTGLVVDPEPPPTCPQLYHPVLDAFCQPINNSFYSDTDDLPDEIGFCMVAEIWGPATCWDGEQLEGQHEDGIDCCIEGEEGDPACPCQAGRPLFCHRM
jgi:hypothetical protein